MRPSFPNPSRPGRGGLFALLALALLLPTSPAEARSRKRQKPSPVTVVLQPFRIARAVVHTVARPIVSHGSRAIVTAATAPARAAYRRVQPFRETEPTRVAYVVPRPSRPAVPVPDQDEVSDEELDQIIDAEPEPERLTRGNRPTVSGSRAILRNGIAYAPARAPQNVKNAIWAANRLRGKPYVWGGGHGSFIDRGYDCSGTVSYALHGAGAIASPLPSSELLRYGERGRGRWFTVYARRGHTFAVIAGLRLDTTDFRNGGNTGPRWHVDMRSTRGYVARHPAGM